MSPQERLRALEGWFRGCLTAAAVLDAVILVMFVTAIRSAEQLVSFALSMVIFGVPFTLLVTCAFTGLPAGAVICVAEHLRIRAMLFYAVAGVAIGALFCVVLFQFANWFGVAFVLGGGPAGIVYWRVAGRYAGEGAISTSRRRARPN